MADPEAGAPDVEAALADPAVSTACEVVLTAWLQRDPVGAARDAEMLAAVLGRRCDQLLGRAA